MKLLSVDTNAKTVKGSKFGYMTGILYLAPSNESGMINTCPAASAGCRMACLYTAGRGAMPNVKSARVKRTVFFASDPAAFVAQLTLDTAELVRKAKRAGKTPAVRLNGTSDISWEETGIMQQFPEVSFYDYTKRLPRMLAYLKGELPANYSLTFSRSESNGAKAELVASMGGNVAVVFDSANYPPAFYGRPTVNGDETDLRFLDPKGVIVALYAKGLAKRDSSGFVVETAPALAMAA